MTKVDDNNCYVGLASDGTDAVPIKVDPVTGALLVEIHYLAEDTRTVNTARIDENNESASIVLGDDDELYSLLIDNRNDYLLVDIT